MITENTNYIALYLTIDEAEKLCAATQHAIRLTEATIDGAKQDGYHPENDCLDSYIEKMYTDIHYSLKKHFNWDSNKYSKWYTKDKRNYNNLVTPPTKP